MGLIRTALRKPISILVLVAALFFFGIKAVSTIKIDIFPSLNLPVIYISHPYGGFTPNQMEGYFGKQYVNLLLYVSGVKSIETKNIQGLTLIKLTFYQGTNMAQAAAECTAFTNRAQAIFPPGSQPPFIIRFDASTLPVGELVLSSPKRSNAELMDMANVYVRAQFTSIPGLVSPAPFGGNTRTILVKVDPDQLRAHNLTAEDVVKAIDVNNQNSPAGNIRIGDTNYMTPSNTTIKTVKDFEDIPLLQGSVQNVYVRDVAVVQDAADVTVSYALVNGKRSVYLPITKSADASTWDVVQNLKKAIPRFQSILPEDVKLSYEFDQSVYVINSVKSLMSEGAIGALLTGLMVLLFLGDIRGALIVILTIPTSIISGVLFLSLFGQTINIMTLSGLSLAIGILVDESTVTIENIHQHLDMGKPKALAIWDACKEIAFPKLLILFCILAVFAPAFSMSGIPGALFLPLALAIAFSMITSYVMAQTFVPVMANWLMKGHKEHKDKTNKHHPGPALTDEEAFMAAHIPPSESDTWDQKKALLNEPPPLTKFEKFRNRYIRFLDRLFPHRVIIGIGYVIVMFVAVALLLAHIGRDVLPRVNGSQFQVRMRAPDGTRLERTEGMTITALNILDSMVGKDNVAVTSAFIGQHPSTFSTDPIYLFMSGPQDAVLQVALKEDYKVNLEDFKDQFRHRIAKVMPDLRLSFEPIELTDKILSQGSPTPIEVMVSGKDKAQNEGVAFNIVDRLKQIPYLRDVYIAQSIRYPIADINIDRVRAAQMNTDINGISSSLTASTSSSRFTDKNVWLDPKVGLGYQVQVEVPENQMTSLDDLREISVKPGTARPTLGDVATVNAGTTYGESDDIGSIPFLTINANLYKKDLGRATDDVTKALADLGAPPRGVTVELRGQSKTLTDTLDSLQGGLLVAIIVIFLMLAANFQSFAVSMVVLFTVPAVLFGSLLMLTLTGDTLNLQSYMGMIMSVGVSISNSVLLITNAEHLRKHNADSVASAKEAAGLRIRPIVMTAVAMVVGMIPMASGLSEGGGQATPLGRAVIGGLVASTFAALFVLPLVFSWVMKKTTTQSVSLDPEDKDSKFFIPSLNEPDAHEQAHR
jgi:multidrug efflux pump subunit AcrB